MNKIYRSLWNEATRTWAAVSENAKGRGKRTAGQVVALALASSTVVLAAPPNPPAPTQLPTGARVVAGTANISQTGATLAIQQSTERVAIDWQSFNIGASAAVTFSQPSASAIALNRVQGVDPSQLFGRLSANGRVFLLNPNGILFAPGAQVDVGGLLASTLAMSADDFMSGRYLLRGDGAGGTITNSGTLRALPQGYVALIAPRVVNDGTIDASRGTAALVAANAATVDFMADGLIRIRVDEGALNAEIANRGAIGAAGGAVLLTAKGLQGLGRAVVNNSGIIEARTLENRNGTITLLGDMAAGTVMVGGDDAARESLAACWRAVAGTVVACGGPGSGQRTKLVNQIAIAGGMIGMCEALLYAHRAGLDVETTLRAISPGAAGSWSLTNLAPRIERGDFAPGFMVEHFVKDMGLALDECRRLDISLPGLALAESLYRRLLDRGDGRLGTQSLVLALAELAGTSWPPGPPAQPA
ncbi:MAG: filamentous hemagglutinin N-terminal domain-containing protein [Betaproteobacteria bacterium]|nr:filamentous hemagglutinin N-terminal domain-containing protein [Betaproteobacteria bacterium]